MSASKKKFPDISDELHVYRFHAGIKLIRPDQVKIKKNFQQGYDTHHTVNTLLQLPFAVYLEDTNNITRQCNDITAEECEFLSANHLIGECWFKHFEKKSIAESLSHHQDVFLQNTAKITYENAIRKDGSKSNDTLSIRMPWYNDENKMMGLLGCSIILCKHSLAESLTQIGLLGLLNLHQINQTNHLMGTEMNSVYLSKRELECLRLTIRGNTAKQIAKNLNLSKWTIEEYLENIKSKVGVSSKAELIDKTIDFFLYK